MNTTMKLLSLAAVSLGILFLALAALGALLEVYLFHVHPLGFIVLAATMFLLGLAIMGYDRFYCSPSDKR
jgi:hypothetical protein